MATLHFGRVNDAPPARLHFGEQITEENPVVGGGPVSPSGIVGGLLALGIYVAASPVGPPSAVSGSLSESVRIEASPVGPPGVVGGTLNEVAYISVGPVGQLSAAGGIAMVVNTVSSHTRCAHSILPNLQRTIRHNTPHTGNISRLLETGYDDIQETGASYRCNVIPLPTINNAVSSGYDRLDLVESAQMTAYPYLRPEQTAGIGSYSVQGLLEMTLDINWPDLVPRESSCRTRWNIMEPIEKVYRNRYGRPTDIALVVIARWGKMEDVEWRYPRYSRPIVPRPPTPSPPAHIFFQRIHRFPAQLHFGRHLMPPQSRRIIVMNPTCSVVRLPDRAVIDATSISIVEQIDSFTKSFRLDTNWAGIQTLFEGAQTPTPLEVEVNSHVWTFVAETYTESTSYGKRNYTVTGYCQAILLASPHSLIRSYNEENTRTASQLAQQELPQDWTLSWQLVNWEVPAGVWAYQNLSPIQAISRLVSTPGGFIQSNPATKTLIAKSIYSTSIWAMDDAEPTAILAGDVQFRVNVDRPASPGQVPYNGVFISGTSQGVAGLIRLPGTQGEKTLILNADSLILDLNVLRERGREELCLAYPRPTITVQVPLFQPPNSPGLIRPGDIVEVRTQYAIYRDIVVNTEINVQVQNNGLVVRQTLRLGASVGNAWVAMDSLTPRSPLMSLNVLSHNADGTSTVELPGGSQIRVRGQSVEIGGMAFVKDDQIIGEAPSLPTYTLDAFDVAP